MMPLKSLATVAALLAVQTVAVASSTDHQAERLHSPALQEMERHTSPSQLPSYIRNGKYVFQLTNDGFLHLYELDEAKAAQLRARFDAGRSGQTQFEAALLQASRRSIWKFDIRAAFEENTRKAGVTTVPALPPQLALSAHESELAVTATVKGDDLPGGEPMKGLPIWSLSLSGKTTSRLHLLANGNLTVDHASTGLVVWQTGTCGGVLRGCGDVGPTK